MVPLETIHTAAGADLQLTARVVPPRLAIDYQEQQTTATFPATTRVKQKENHAAEKAITGVKHPPKTRPGNIEPGSDECGEDGTSIMEDGSYVSRPMEPRHNVVRETMKFLVPSKAISILPRGCLDLE